MKMSGLSPMAHGAMMALCDLGELHFVPERLAEELFAAGLAEPVGEAVAITPKGRAWRPFVADEEEFAGSPASAIPVRMGQLGA